MPGSTWLSRAATALSDVGDGSPLSSTVATVLRSVAVAREHARELEAMARAGGTLDARLAREARAAAKDAASLLESAYRLARADASAQRARRAGAIDLRAWGDTVGGEAQTPPGGAMGLQSPSAPDAASDASAEVLSGHKAPGGYEARVPGSDGGSFGDTSADEEAALAGLAGVLEEAMAEGGEAGLDEALRGMVRDEPVRFGMSPERWAAEAERKAKETKARAAVAETRARIMQQRIARQAAAKKKAEGAGE